MEENLPNKGDAKQYGSNNNSICDKFDKIPFPMGQFCPPQKDEFIKRKCDKRCRECPFFGWPMPGPPGSPGRDGKDGADGNNGTDGTNGLTPTIGANGSWWIGETDTGVPAQGQDGADGTNGTNGTDGTDGLTPTIGANGNWWIGGVDTGEPSRGLQGPPGTFNASSLFVWKSDQQALAPAASAGDIGDAVEFTDSVVGGTALSFTSPTEINIMQPGHYSIRWEIYKSGYDSAFALFFDPDGGGGILVPGSNYGALSHDERYSGQAIAVLTAGGTLTLNCISTINPQEIQNEISDNVMVTGASIVIIKIS